MMTGEFGRVAALGLALTLWLAGGASAGIVGPDPALQATVSAPTLVQYGYGYGYRPYRAYPRYGYAPRRRYYNNHFGPGARKERHRTNLTFCRNQPSRC